MSSIIAFYSAMIPSVTTNQVLGHSSLKESFRALRRKVLPILGFMVSMSARVPYILCLPGYSKNLVNELP